jgi:electron transfer flavoprotein alpha subunit
MGATELRPATDGGLEAIASVFGGSARAVYRFGAGTKVLSVGPKFTDPPARESGRAANVEQLDAPAPTPRVEVVEAAAESGPRLEDAKVVVSGGRGIQDGANFQHVRDLAAALGGLPGASRAIVDLGWAPLAEQVGLTGKITSPDLYIAAGISGASQHMMGCSTARVLVAINTDANAQIFKYAHFGIVGDAVEVLKELAQQAKG